jgi:hypothetical protein
MAHTDEHTRSMYIYGVSRLLLTLRRRFLEDSKSNYEIIEEKQEIRMDGEMHGRISKD